MASHVGSACVKLGGTNRYFTVREKSRQGPLMKEVGKREIFMTTKP
jgi:hypothetical protein